MPILQSDTVTGLDYNTVRPNSKAQMLEQLKQIAKDQTAVYKMATNIDAPRTSPVGQASGHVHDGVNGAILPHPLMQFVCNITLISDSNGEGWQKCVYSPFYVPAGVFKVKVLGVFSNKEAINNFRFGTADTDGNILSNPFNAQFKRSGPTQATRELTVTPDAINLIICEGWRGSTQAGGSKPLVNIALNTLIILPDLEEPRKVGSFKATDGDGSARFPSADQYKGNYFTPLNSTMFQSGMPVSSYIAVGLALNDALLGEVITGQKASNMETRTLTGHNHEGSTTDLNKCGASIPHALGSWPYGCAIHNASGNVNIDSNDPYSNSWLGLAAGLTLDGSAGTSYNIISKHHFCFPASKTTLWSGATSQIRANVLIYKDSGKSGTVTVRARIQTRDELHSGPYVTVNDNGVTGREVIEIPGLELPSTGIAVDGEGAYKIEIAIKQSTTTDTATFIYGSCLHLN